MSAASDIIRDVFGSDESGDLTEHAVRLRAVLHLTDPYYESQRETGETIREALGNSFDNVEVQVLEEIDTDPFTGIQHFPGVDD